MVIVKVCPPLHKAILMYTPPTPIFTPRRTFVRAIVFLANWTLFVNAKPSDMRPCAWIGSSKRNSTLVFPSRSAEHACSVPPSSSTRSLPVFKTVLMYASPAGSLTPHNKVIRLKVVFANVTFIIDGTPLDISICRGYVIGTRTAI